MVGAQPEGSCRGSQMSSPFAFVLAALGLCSCQAQGGVERGPPSPAPQFSERPTPPAAPSLGLTSVVAGSVAAQRRALLVGINDYLYDGEIQDLRGTANDVEAMRDVLTRRFDFAPENVLILRDRKATRANILKEFGRHLIDPASPDTVAVFYLSGHGSQTYDTSGDEADGYDETLVTYDSGRSEHENRDLTDDELNELIGQLNAKTSHVTVILDSCHSGTAARAAGVIKAAPRDDRGRPAQPGPRGTTPLPTDGASGFRPKAMSYVLIAGAESQEFSYERVIEGRPMGALTWFLTRALWTSPPQATYRDIMDRVASDVAITFPAQHPQVEGLEQDSVLFGTAHYLPQPYFEVTTAAGRIELAAGAVHGVTVHSRFAAYAPGTKVFAGIQPLAELEVTKVEGTRSEVSSSNDTPMPPGVRAVEVEHQFDEVALRVKLLDPAGTQKAISKARATLSRVAVGLHDYGQLALVETGAYDMAAGIDIAKGSIFLEGGTAGARVGVIPSTDVAEAVRQLVAWGKWYALWRLSNESSPLSLSLSVEGSETDVPAGRELEVKLHNDSSSRLYFSLLDLSFDGSIALAFPPAGAHEFIEPGATWRHKLTPCVPAQRSEIQDVLKVFSTQKPHDLSLVQQDPTEKSLARSVGNNQRRVEDLLGAIVLGERAKGLIPPSRMPIDGWATRQLAIHVHAAPGAESCAPSVRP